MAEYVSRQLKARSNKYYRETAFHRISHCLSLIACYLHDHPICIYRSLCSSKSTHDLGLGLHQSCIAEFCTHIIYKFICVHIRLAACVYVCYVRLCVVRKERAVHISNFPNTKLSNLKAHSWIHYYLPAQGSSNRSQKLYIHTHACSLSTIHPHYAQSN